MLRSVVTLAACLLAWLAAPQPASAQKTTTQELFLVTSGGTNSVLRYDAAGVFVDAFIPSGSGGLMDPRAVIEGPDGNIYVSGMGGVRRYDGTTGAFIDLFAQMPGVALFGLVFGPDGNLYAIGFSTNNVLRFDGATGAFIDVFASGGGLLGPRGLVFGPDGNLYVGSARSLTPGTGKVIRYDGATGALLDDFATGVDARGLVFGPDGNLYVASFSDNSVMRFNGTTGAFMDVFASGGGLSGPVGLRFGSDGNLYVSSFNNHRVLRYSGTTGAFIDEFVPAGSGGLSSPRFLTTTRIAEPAASRTLKPDVELVARSGLFEFNGLNQHINLGRSSILHLGARDFTVHAWVNFASLASGGPPCFGPGCDMSIVDKMAGANENGWRLMKQSDNRFWFCLGIAGGDGCQPGAPTTVIGSTQVVPNVWYSVTAVKAAGTISIYVNGVLEATSSFTAFTDTNAADLLIGAAASGGAFLNGRVGQVELFRRALNDGNVRAIHERSKARYGR